MKRNLKDISFHLWMMANLVWVGAAMYYLPLWWKFSWWSVLNSVLVISAGILYTTAYFMKPEEEIQG